MSVIAVGWTYERKTEVKMFLAYSRADVGDRVVRSKAILTVVEKKKNNFDTYTHDFVNLNCKLYLNVSFSNCNLSFLALKCKGIQTFNCSIINNVKVKKITFRVVVVYAIYARYAIDRICAYYIQACMCVCVIMYIIAQSRFGFHGDRCFERRRAAAMRPSQEASIAATVPHGTLRRLYTYIARGRGEGGGYVIK